jgi:hypothetical protein
LRDAGGKERERIKRSKKERLDKKMKSTERSSTRLSSRKSKLQKRERERREYSSEQEMPSICCYRRTKKKKNVLELADCPCIY